MLQLIYVSSKAPTAPIIDLDDLLRVSQRNNAGAGITGLLYSDGHRFLQAVEGPEPAIGQLLVRLGRDDRHRAMVTLSRRSIEAREFGDWSMARLRPGEHNRSLSARIETLCRAADPRVFGMFAGLIEARSAVRR